MNSFSSLLLTVSANMQSHTTLVILLNFRTKERNKNIALRFLGIFPEINEPVVKEWKSSEVCSHFILSFEAKTKYNTKPYQVFNLPQLYNCEEFLMSDRVRALSLSSLYASFVRVS